LIYTSPTTKTNKTKTTDCTRSTGSDQEGNACSLHAISSIPITGRQKSILITIVVNSAITPRHQSRETTPHLHHDLPGTPHSHGTATSPLCTWPSRHLRHCTRRPPINAIVQSRPSPSCPVPSPSDARSCPRRLDTAGAPVPLTPARAPACVPCHDAELATSTHQVCH
jgi:hypothetical protein